MSSIATKTGDSGTTGLPGGLRLSKSDLLFETIGTIDELSSVLGFARSLCTNPDINSWTESIQRTLFRVGSALSTPVAALATTRTLTREDVDLLTQLSAQLETTPGILDDASPLVASSQSAAYRVAGAVCRRAERVTARFLDSGRLEPEPSEAGQPFPPRLALAFLNHLSGLIQLFARLIELRARA
jgi:cob(I)alamin adenosyltransferase